MKQVSITINDVTYDLIDLGEQQLDSSHLRSDICYHFCDLMKQCGRFLYNAAIPCLLACDTMDEGNGFYFKKRQKYDCQENEGTEVGDNGGEQDDR